MRSKAIIKSSKRFRETFNNFETSSTKSTLSYMLKRIIRINLSKVSFTFLTFIFGEVFLATKYGKFERSLTWIVLLYAVVISN